MSEAGTSQCPRQNEQTEREGKEGKDGETKRKEVSDEEEKERRTNKAEQLIGVWKGNSEKEHEKSKREKETRKAGRKLMGDG